jgi:hypothetical protein
MKMTEILEKDKDKLLTELSAAATAEKAVSVLDKELDKLLLRHNEQAGSDREREAAAYMVQAVRLSLPLMDSNGKTKVWESGTEAKEEVDGSFKISFMLLLILGLALCVFGAGPMLMEAFIAAEDKVRDTVLLHGGAVVAGMVCLYFSGYMYARPKRKKASKKEHQVEIRIDADKVYRNFRNTILAVDQSIEEIRYAAQREEQEKAGTIDGKEVTQSELDLFSDLLAAAYSGDPEFALEKVEQIKYFLHRNQIEVVDYSKDTAQYFDLMPGTAPATIRPALVAQGGLLRKGLAAKGR